MVVLQPPSVSEMMSIVDNYWIYVIGNNLVNNRNEIQDKLRECKSLRPLKSSMRELDFDRPDNPEQALLDALDKYISVQL